jgi:DNA-binding response OmpR family regulator
MSQRLHACCARAARPCSLWVLSHTARAIQCNITPVSIPLPQTVLLVRAPTARVGEAVLASLRQRFAIEEVGTIDLAIEVLRERCLGLVLLADDLADARALTLLRGFTPLWRGAYVLLADERHDVAEQIVALEAGFDDVWPPTMDPRLAVARARALVRRPVRSADPAPDAVEAYGLVFDRTRRVLSYNDRDVSLSPRESDVLTVLMQHRGKVVERSDFHVPDSLAPQVSPSAVDLLVFRLRQRLGAVGAAHVGISSARGRGYALRLGHVGDPVAARKLLTRRCVSGIK